MPPSARTFRTRQVDDPRGFVRTFGAIVDVSERGVAAFAEADALALAHPAPAGCARGKVAAFAGTGAVVDAVCYQLSDATGRARIVACSNAAAAVAVQSGAACVRLVVGGVSVRVDAEVEASLVRQTWRGVPFAPPREAVVRGRSVALSVGGALNDYLVVRTRPGERASDIGAAEAEALWQAAGPPAEPLRARLAVVQPGSTAHVRFFTCDGREHPSAPLTGLAVLALASAHIDWLALDARVITPSGPMALPRATVERGLATVEFPRIIVDLEPLALSA